MFNLAPYLASSSLTPSVTSSVASSVFPNFSAAAASTPGAAAAFLQHAMHFYSTFSRPLLPPPFHFVPPPPPPPFNVLDFGAAATDFVTRSPQHHPSAYSPLMLSHTLGDEPCRKYFKARNSLSRSGASVANKCPVCGQVVEPADMNAHYLNELERIGQLFDELKSKLNGGKQNFEADANGENRLKILQNVRNRKRDRAQKKFAAFLMRQTTLNDSNLNQQNPENELDDHLDVVSDCLSESAASSPRDVELAVDYSELARAQRLQRAKCDPDVDVVKNKAAGGAHLQPHCLHAKQETADKD